MTGTSDKKDTLAPFFHAARSRPEVPDSDLLARVLATAETEQAVHARAASAAGSDRFAETGAKPDAQTAGRPPIGMWQRLSRWAARIRRAPAPLRALGGWPVAAGFVAATGAGLWIGTLPQTPIAGRGLFAVAEAGTGFEVWADVAAFGLGDEGASLDIPAGLPSGEDTQ